MSPDPAGWRPDPTSAGDGHQARRTVTKAPSARLLVALGAGAAAVIAAVVLLLADGSGSADGGDPAAEEAGDVTTEALRDDMQTALAELEDAETFAFAARIVIPPPTDVFVVANAGPELAVDRFDLNGDVNLRTGFMRQAGAASGFFTDTIEERLALGDRAWRRASAFSEVLHEVPWIPEEDVPEPFPPLGSTYLAGSMDNLPDAFDPRLLPAWLAAAADHQDGGTDEGNRVVIGWLADDSIPGRGGATTAGEPTLSGASVELTVDHNGLPLRVVIMARANDGQARAYYDLTALGGPVTTDVPAPDDLDPLPAVQDRDIAFAQEITADDGRLTPVGLASPPEGWQLMRVDVSDPSAPALADDRTRCPPVIHVGYRRSDAWLDISTTPSGSICVSPLDESLPRPITPGGDPVEIPSRPVTAGEHEGTIIELADPPASDGDDAPVAPVLPTLAEFTIEGMFVTVNADGVPGAELANILASLDPIDPGEQAQPQSMDQPAPGSSG